MTSSPSFSALSSALLSYALEEFNSAAPFFDAALAELTVEEKGEEAVVDSGAGGRAKAGRASAEEVARVRLARAANSLQRSDFAGPPQQHARSTPPHSPHGMHRTSHPRQ